LAASITPEGSLAKSVSKLFSGLIGLVGNLVNTIIGGGVAAKLTVTVSDEAVTKVTTSDQAMTKVTVSDETGA